MNGPAFEIASLYNTVAKEFDRDRSKDLMERFYLREVLTRIQGRKSLLDLGCGSGEPIARYFIEAGCSVTGVDIAPAMLEMCRTRFPNAMWIEGDMRTLDIPTQFDAIVAWDSFFHLPHDDQRGMFATFERQIAPNGLLLFTSGPSEGEAIGEIYGNKLYHASLSTEEYTALLLRRGFNILLHRVEDPDCGGHTVWLAHH